MLEKNTRQINQVIARMLALCSVALLIMTVLSFLGVFEFENEYIILILIPGLVISISPIILIRFAPPSFMKYYMLILASLFIGMLGTSNHVGVYITYALVPIFSCLYFEPPLVVKTCIFSYLTMLASIFISTSDRYEVVLLGQSRISIFTAYALGFTIEYLIVSMVLLFLVRRAKKMMEERYSAEEQNQMKSRFLSNMSHEIRTPMNAIIGMADVALRNDLDEDTRRCLTVIQSSSTGLLEIINDILDLSKIEAGKMDMIEAPYTVQTLIDDMELIINARNFEHKVPIYYHVQDNIPQTLVGDSVRIKQVMFNFASNAIKYTDSGRIDISIGCETRDGVAELTCSVKDTGEGIREEDMSQLFNMYSQFDKERNHSKEGSGIGLAICKYFIERMGGTISVESKYGEGSRFSFTVPQLISDVPAEDAPRDTSAANFTTHGAHILLTDDNDINREVVIAMLEPLHIRIDEAENGAEAVRKANETPYDLILMDSHMPEMSGEEATELIRQNSGCLNHSTPIIALTADAITGVREKLLSAGMNDYLAKPIDPGELFRMLKKYLPADKVITE